MTTNTLVVAILDSLLYATTAIVLSLASREFRLYNLACGAWIVTGGWLGAMVIGSITGVATAANWWLVPFAVFALLTQIGITFLTIERILNTTTL